MLEPESEVKKTEGRDVGIRIGSEKTEERDVETRIRSEQQKNGRGEP
jgi:hypothetical protein